MTTGNEVDMTTSKSPTRNFAELRMAELQNDACVITCTGNDKLYNTKEEMVLTGEDDSKVLARAASRIKKLVPPAAIAGKATFITPVRARGKRAGNLVRAMGSRDRRTRRRNAHYLHRAYHRWRGVARL